MSEGLTNSLVFSYNSNMMLCQELIAKNFSNFLIDRFSPFGSQEILVKRTTSEFFTLNEMGYCKEGVANIFRLDGNQRKKGGGQRHILSSKIRHLLTVNKTDQWSEKTLLEGLKILYSKKMWLKIFYDEVGWRVFEGMQRGSPRYCKMFRHKIIDRAQDMIRRGGEIMALTVTFDAKNFTENRIKAWEEYSKLLSRLMKELRRKYKCEYISVLESTNKGYPHAHIILAFKKGTIPYYGKLKNKTKIKYGELFNIVKKFAPARKFHLEVIKGNATAFYLVKYIAKGEKKDIFELLKKDGHLTKDERKLLQCLLYCTACETRQVRMSEKIYFDDSVKPDAQVGIDSAGTAAGQTDASPQKESGTAAWADHPDQDLPAGENSTAKRWALITRCNNLPRHCLHHIYVMSHKRKMLLFGDADGRAIESDYEKSKLFDKNAAIVGCGGCFFALVAKAVILNDIKKINIVYWDKDYRRKRWFDGVDLADDAAFVDALERLITFYLAAISSQEYTTTEFFGIGEHIGLNPFNLQGITKATKNHYKVHQNRVDELWRLDDYERKMTAHESRAEINY